MRALLAELPITPTSEEAEIAGVGGGVGVASWWLSDCHGVLYNLALIIPTVLFVAYLGSQARRSFARLTYGRSHIMIAYYALLWVVTILNLLWCLLQVNTLENYTKLSRYFCLIRLYVTVIVILGPCSYEYDYGVLYTVFLPF